MLVALSRCSNCFVAMQQLLRRDAASNLLCILFHRDAFGEVPWAVNIFAFADSDVVGEQLQGNAGDEGLEAFERVGQGDDVVGVTRPPRARTS